MFSLMKTLLSSLFLFVLAAPVLAEDIAWSVKAGIPAGSYDFASCAVNGKLYVIGGCNSDGAVIATVQEYDPASNSWTRKADMPTARQSASLLAVNGKIYVIGGNDGSYYLKVTEEYNPATNEWIGKADMPEAKEQFGTCILNGSIYLIGGFNGVNCVNTVQVFDPIGNVWASKAGMPTARQSLGVCVVNNKIYAVGGENLTSYLSSCEEYDPETNSWVVKAAFSTPRYGFSSAVINNKLYVVGGYGLLPDASSEGELSSLEEYDPATNIWTKKANMPTSRFFLSTSVLNNKLYAIDGWHVYDAVSTVEEYDPAGNKWAVKTSLSEKRCDTTVCQLNGKFYVVGGYDQATQSIVEEGVFGENSSDSEQLRSVDDLMVVPLTGAKVKLSWTRSTSKDVAEYNIYCTENPDLMVYNEPFDILQHPAESWVSFSGEFEADKTYYFVVRAVNASGEEEKNTNMVSASIVSDITKITKAVVRNPQNGKKIAGNRVMVTAESISTKSGKLKNVLFQYKKLEDTTWTDVKSANASRPNPSLKQPFFMHWDISNLDEGIYNLRAVATGANGVADKTPGYITIEINRSDPDVLEVRNEKGEQEKNEKVDTTKNIILKTAGENSSGITQITIPKGTIDVQNLKIRVVVDPQEKAAPPENVKETGEYRLIELDGAAFKGRATIVIPFSDDNFDNRTDDSNIPVDSLCVFAFDTKTATWERLPSQVDTVAKTVTGWTTHFSLFALFGAPPADFGTARAYPNPFIPSKGHTFIKFDNLAANTKLQIFTVSGDPVFEKENINSGEFSWDGVNQAGTAVVSGVYVCLLRNEAGAKKIIKVAVIK